MTAILYTKIETLTMISDLITNVLLIVAVCKYLAKGD